MRIRKQRVSKAQGQPLPAGPRPAERLPGPSDWSFELIEEYHRVIRDTAARFGLDTYPNQLEVITAEQMMDAYASVGMPVNYRHWSYGKEFISTEKNYKRGHMGLAYEIVINSNPCISYLMEENTMAMQALVIAHAAYGHNSFFKGNYLFRMWTDASSIIDYLVYAKNYIAECEERHGMDEVEALLDSCHAQNIVLYGTGGTVRFDEIFSGDPNELDAAEKLTVGQFDVVVGICPAITKLVPPWYWTVTS